MIFEQVATGGSQSNLVGCDETRAAALTDPEIGQLDHCRALASGGIKAWREAGYPANAGSEP